MNKTKSKPEKTVEEYRRDIFALKEQLKEEENYLTELKQQYQNADIFGDTSYSYSMKLKILECKNLKTKITSMISGPN